MKITFIVPCSEPGKDGVGDYTRRLFEWMKKNHWDCSIIAWNDSFVTNPQHQENELRLPKGLDEKRKVSLAKRELEKNNPDIISLQWVPHGYHPKGLFLPQIHSLGKLTQPYPVELMIHEIWLGAKSESTAKEHIIGLLQKKLFKQLLRKLSISLIHTQSNAYKHLLLKQCIHANKLPLFSNIEVTQTKELKAETQSIRAGFFGAIHPETNIDILVKSLIEYSENQGLPITISQAGRLSEQGRSLFEQWKQKWQGKIEFESLGQISSSEVSTYLKSLHFGLSTTPFALIDKSGSVAAMWEHDLPVISLRDDVSFPGFEPNFEADNILTELTQETIKLQFETKKGISNKPCIDQIGKQFIDSLLSVTK